MTKLRPRPSAAMNLTTKTFSVDEALSARKLFANVSASWYTPELMMLSARLTAAWQASRPPLTVTPAHELYPVALIPPAPAESFVNTPAFTYILARMASTAPLVMRPLLALFQLTGSSG